MVKHYKDTIFRMSAIIENKKKDTIFKCKHTAKI